MQFLRALAAQLFARPARPARPARLAVESLEAREVPAALPNPNLPTNPDYNAVGTPNKPVYLALANASGGGFVAVLNFQTQAEEFRVTPFGSGYTAGIAVATADVTGDDVPDLICASQGARTSTIVVYDGDTHAQIATIIPWGTTDKRKVYVAAGDFNGDDKADIVVGSNRGGQVQVLDGATLSSGNPISLGQFNAYATSYTGGVRVATGDVNKDGQTDILTVTAHGRPIVAGFDGKQINRLNPFQPFSPYYAAGTGVTQGGWISSADVNGDGYADVVTGRGNGSTQALIIDGKTLPLGGNPTVVRTVNLDPTTAQTGARVLFADLNADGTQELVIASNTGARPVVAIYNATTGAKLTAFYAFGRGFLGGVNVG